MVTVLSVGNNKPCSIELEVFCGLYLIKGGIEVPLRGFFKKKNHFYQHQCIIHLVIVNIWPSSVNEPPSSFSWSSMAKLKKQRGVVEVVLNWESENMNRSLRSATYQSGDLDFEPFKGWLLASVKRTTHPCCVYLRGIKWAFLNWKALWKLYIFFRCIRDYYHYYKWSSELW